MATIPTYSQEYSDKVAQDNLNAALSGVSTSQKGNTSSGYTKTAGPAQSPSHTNTPTVASSSPSFDTNAFQQSQLDRARTELEAMQNSLNTQQTVGDMITDAGGTGFATESYEGDPYQPEPFDEKKAQREATRNQLKLHQAEIDATNQVYDQLLAESRLQGEGRLGSQRAMAARGGLLGSDFAGAQKAKVQDFNTGKTRGIQAERTAAIGAIMGEVRDSVAQEIKAKREARAAGAEEYMNFLAQRGERRDNYLNQLVGNMLTQGYDISQFSEDELNEFGKEAGFKAQDIIAAYQRAKSASDAASAEADLETRKTEAEIDKINADIEKGKVVTIGEGTMLYNKETGEYFKNPKTYKPDAPSGLRIGDTVLTQEEIAGVHGTLNDTRGEPYENEFGEMVTPPPEDNYANTKVYMDELQAFVDLKGDPKDFIEEFEPDLYINPQDPTRSFLQQYMKKTVAQQEDETVALMAQYQALMDEN